MATIDRPTGIRRPHFRRSSPQPIMITDDDIALFRDLDQYRFRRSTDLARVLSHRRPKKVIERLTQLFHAGYVDRPEAQRDWYTARKRTAYVYAMADKAAQLLASLDGKEPAKGVAWRDKNRDAGRPFLHHELMVADVITAFATALRARNDIKIIAPATILERSPDATKHLENPWKWHAKIPAAGGLLQNLAIIPDHMFGLDFTVKRKRVYFAVEADRSTMPVWRTDLRQSSMRKKFSVYHFGHRAQFHTHQYAIGNCRVLTVTSTPQRATSMIDAVRRITDGLGSMFLFTDADTLKNTPDVLSLVWTNGKGEPVRLID